MYLDGDCKGKYVRLSGSEETNEGRVEVCLNGKWGPVCRDSSWGVQDSRVVCKELGFSIMRRK